MNNKILISAMGYDHYWWYVDFFLDRAEYGVAEKRSEKTEQTSWKFAFSKHGRITFYLQFYELNLTVPFVMTNSRRTEL